VNLALDHYADNPIIDELIFWPPKTQKILSVRACTSMFRKPFIEVEMQQGDVFHRHFPRDSFADFWAEAVLILETLTDIELISEFRLPAIRQREQQVRDILAVRDESIAETNKMYDEGMYHQFLLQYGPNCKNLPPECQRRLAHAQDQFDSGS